MTISRDSRYRYYAHIIMIGDFLKFSPEVAVQLITHVYNFLIKICSKTTIELIRRRDVDLVCNRKCILCLKSRFHISMRCYNNTQSCVLGEIVHNTYMSFTCNTVNRQRNIKVGTYYLLTHTTLPPTNKKTTILFVDILYF